MLSRSSAFALKGEELSPRQIGHKLNVGSVLLGRVTRTKENLVIAVELVDTNSGLNIWTEQYIGERSDLVDIQDKIMRQITKVLRGGRSSAATRVLRRVRLRSENRSLEKRTRWR